MLYQILSGSHFSRNTWKTCDDLRGIQPSRHRMCKARSMWCVSKHALHIMIYACWGKGHCLSHVKNINTLKLLKMYAYTETNIYYHILQYISNILLYIWSSPWPMAHHCACAIVQQLLLDPAETIAATMWLTGWLAFLENETNSNYELSYGVGSHSIHSSLAGSPWIFLGNMMAYGYPFTAPNTPLPLAG